MREKIIEMLDMVLANEGLTIEVNNDVHKGRVIISERIDVWKWQTKYFSDTDPDCDGTLQQGIYYLKSITERQEA